LNVQGVIDVRQTEILTADHLMPEPGFFEVELAVEKLSRLTSYAEEIIGDHHRGFDATGQLLIIYSAFI
jgi:hypothetical protein